MNNTQSPSGSDDVGGHGFRAPDAADSDEHNEDVQGHGRFSGLDVEAIDDEETDTEGHGFRGN